MLVTAEDEAPEGSGGQQISLRGFRGGVAVDKDMIRRLMAQRQIDPYAAPVEQDRQIPVMISCDPMQLGLTTDLLFQPREFLLQSGHRNGPMHNVAEQEQFAGRVIGNERSQSRYAVLDRANWHQLTAMAMSPGVAEMKVRYC